MTETTVTFVVNYTDPERDVEGTKKTRHFSNEHDARVFMHEDLDKIAPKHHSVMLTKITCKKERIQI